MQSIQKISVIGPGKVGTVLAKQLYDTGKYQLYIAARNFAKASQAAHLIGPQCKLKTIQEAAGIGDLVLLSISNNHIEPKKIS